MTGFATGAFTAALLANLLAAVGWAVAAQLLGRRLGRVNSIDTLWGLGFCLIAVVSELIAISTGSGDGLRQVVLVALVLGWGGRLAWHVGRRSAGNGEDPRYADLLDKHGGHRTLTAWTFTYLPQLVTLYVVSSSVQVGMFTGPPMRVIGWLGVVVVAIGIAFEAIGDAQMSRFKADPTKKGQLIDVGLWRYTRHPNYFGDACVWIGIYLVAAEHWPGMLTIVSPALMTYLLAFGIGKRLLEQSLGKRPGYAEYMRRTSGFVPRCPVAHRNTEQPLTRASGCRTCTSSCYRRVAGMSCNLDQRGHLFRAGYEGIAFGIRQILEYALGTGHARCQQEECSP